MTNNPISQEAYDAMHLRAERAERREGHQHETIRRLLAALGRLTDTYPVTDDITRIEFGHARAAIVVGRDRQDLPIEEPNRHPDP